MPAKLRILRVVRLTLLVCGPIFLALSLGMAIHTALFLRASRSAFGTITALDQRTDAEGTVTYVPTFSFHTPDGNLHLIVSETGSNPPGFEVGETVTVKYLPDRPLTARINSFAQLWLMPLVFGVFGAAMLLAYAVLHLVGCRNTPA